MSPNKAGSANSTLWNKVKSGRLPKQFQPVLIHLSGSLIVAKLRRGTWLNDWDDTVIAKTKDNLVTEWAQLPELPGYEGFYDQ